MGIPERSAPSTVRSTFPSVKLTLSMLAQAPEPVVLTEMVHFPATFRLRAYREESGTEADEALAQGDYSRESGARGMRELLERVPDLDAVFAANDVMALGALDVLREAGRRVPEDVAVAGFDDIAQSVLTEPTLTTVRQPFGRISEEMVRLLLGVIGGEKPAAMTLPAELVVRAST